MVRGCAERECWGGARSICGKRHGQRGLAVSGVGSEGRQLLEYREAVRACAMRCYPRNLGIFLILIVFRAVGPILPFSPFVL